MDVSGYQQIWADDRYVSGSKGKEEGWQHHQTGYCNVCSYRQNSASQRAFVCPG